jgi:hypothetical protein
MSNQSEPFKINNRLVEPGTELSVTGETGRFVFRWMTGDDLTCWGGKSGREKYRTFSPDRVKRVHIKKVLRNNVEEDK